MASLGCAKRDSDSGSEDTGGISGTLGGTLSASDTAADAGDGDGDATASGDDGGDDGELLDVGVGTDTGGDGSPGEGGDPGDCSQVTPPTPNAAVNGFVFAPNLEIPISGALVYLTDDDPEPIPDGVYCAECVSLQCDEHFTLTAADGSFSLPAVAGAGQKLVVQKGQFLHVTEIEVVQGPQTVPAVDSSLPGEWNPVAGHYIPRIAVFQTYNDEISNLLAKIGLGEVDGNGGLVAGTEAFDFLNPSTDNWILDSYDSLSNYHIIFVPCMSQSGLGSVGARVDPIREFVDAGGKWYVTDWANEYLYEPFPSYQDFHGGGNPDLGSYDTTGNVVDPDLLSWLQALPTPLKNPGGGLPDLNSLPSVGLHDNWSGLDQVNEIWVDDGEGDQVNVGHNTWVEGPCGSCSDSNVRPMTISGGYGCGRMMFSTYHTTEGSHTGLAPQELILLYLILEIGVCHDVPPPPPPPVP